MSQELELHLYELDDETHRLNLVTPAEGYTYTPDDVSNLVAVLANTRAQMLPAIPFESPPIENMQNVADNPAMRWAYDEMNDRFALLIRHPGHGWIGYSLPFETVTALQRGLQEVADHRSQQRQKPN
ncbi:hypothetical protein WR30_11065 [Burkholderia contaminans FFH2055]|uniref:hypothetical protein n=1 Tax=Burkholderia contaminans TaxID=488447 RepID=UPI000635F717|nr:hypothetical protein [Burkholderia contaminans]KKL38594.1 hypothetical protein WR30_11065 [Burkholderia contaminans FFH2055]MEB4631137.1 hypothetical protein [Burkholderia contaminans]MEB4638015.1 hypothetical protein [Burkholderia contaminans]MEB4653099.1 hypothetical protein [Burkholderia contaminans]MEB4658135.1 hypothetical protein [Burkholderia contaminans]